MPLEGAARVRLRRGFDRYARRARDDAAGVIPARRPLVEVELGDELGLRPVERGCLELGDWLGVPDRSNEMTDVTVTNRRADSSANEDLAKLARHGADAFGYKAHLHIDRQLAQLLRLRVSQINNCAYCLNLHYEAARDAGIPRPVIDTLTAWWETDFHNDAACAALAYTEAITRVADATVADDFGARHDALAEHFSREEILEIIGIVINMNVWTRLKMAEGAVPGLAEQAMS